MDRYSLKVFWSVPDDAWVCVCPEFPGLSVVEPTRIRAIAEAEIVLKDFIAITEQDGDELPIPAVWTMEKPTQIREHFEKCKLKPRRSKMSGETIS